MNPERKSRVQSVDALRGFVMIVMALDHTRDFFHYGALQFSPEDLSRTTTDPVFHPLDHTFLRTGVLFHGRDRRIFLDARGTH
jgi:uncharacterized membrane protein